MLHRLAINLLYYHAGIVKGLSTTDQIFTIQQILQKCHKFQVITHYLTINSKATYDTIDREELWKIMNENGYPAKLTILVKTTMDDLMCCVKIWDPFDTRKGFRIDDGLSRLLFNIALEGDMKQAALHDLQYI